MNLVIAAGGTGGHLFPGVAVGEVLLARGHEVMLVVSEKEIDALATEGRQEFRVEKVTGVGLQGKSPGALFEVVRKFRAGLKQCHALFASFAPRAVLGMGGFTSLAPLLAGRKRRIATFVHESNALPGKANRINAHFCTAVLLGFEECGRYFKRSRSIVTGTPIRQSLTHPVDKAQALRSFNLTGDRRTLLVIGGSQGAHGLNLLVADALPSLRERRLQVIHLTGRKDEATIREAYARATIPAYVAPFSQQMGDAYSAADLCIARSGAATLTELSHFALPAILIPYPHAAGDHQTLNAKIFERAGAAAVLPERETTGDILVQRILAILDDPARLAEMSSRSAALAPRNAAERVADVILEHCQP